MEYIIVYLQNVLLLSYVSTDLEKAIDFKLPVIIIGQSDINWKKNFIWKLFFNDTCFKLIISSIDYIKV